MIKVYIRDTDYGAGKDVWVVNKKGEETFILKPFVFEMIKEERNSFNEPTMRLSGELAEAFLLAFAEALDKQGIKTDNDFKIRGLLEAKESHLQDMRSLVFKQDVNNAKI